MEVDFDQVKIVKERPYLSYSKEKYLVKVRAHVFLFFYKWVTIYTFYKYPSDILTDTFAKELIHTISKL
jgi:hypothetical protein